jgi:diacylglycerol kinase
MIFSDVAVVRTVVAVAIMLLVAFFARRHSKFSLVLVAAAIFFLFCEMFNTVTEMIVDRISLESNAFSARIKHASAFISAVAGFVAFSFLFVVLYNLLFSPSSAPPQPSSTAPTLPHPTPLSLPAPAAPPVALPAAAPPVALPAAAPPVALPAAPMTLLRYAKRKRRYARRMKNRG